MKQGFYVSSGTSQSPGVVKKIEGQINEINKHHNMRLLTAKPTHSSSLHRIMRLFFCVSQGYDYKSLFDEMNKPDFIYWRRAIFDCGIYDFFKKIKKAYPNCKIIVEIPTYPYFRDNFAKDIKSFFRNWPFWIKDCIYRSRIKKYVDRYVVNTDDRIVFGVNTINTLNGVNIDAIKPNDAVSISDEINIIGVAALAPHHGFERMIIGIYNYYKSGGKRSIVFNIVGDGKERTRYNELINKYHIEDRVFLLGKKTGNDLDTLYDRADLAVESLAIYKYGLSKVSTLKLGEYLAKGLPVISSVNTIDTLESRRFIKYFANDSSPIDISEVVSFYDKTYGMYDRKTVIESIRVFAKKNFSFEATMKPIIDFIDI